MSWTLPGRPWVDFEWLPQMLYSAVFLRWGMTGLWLLKAGIIAVSGLVFLKLLERRGVPKALWAGAYLLWAAAVSHQSDLRPDAFSLIAFTAQLAYLGAADGGQSGDAMRHGVPALAIVAECLGFASFYSLWADCHAGFAIGLAALGIHFFWRLVFKDKAAIRLSGIRLAAAALGSMLNPYGLALWRVIIEHLSDSVQLRRSVLEWRPPPLDRPLWLLAALAALVAARRFLIKRQGGGVRDWSDLSLMALVGLLAAGSRRLEPYFAVSTLPAVGAWLGEDEPALGRARRPLVFPALLAGFMAFILATTRAPWLSGRSLKPFDSPFICRRAAEWLRQNERPLGCPPAFHLWGWGGYLGWRLPGFKIFADGRYIFHGLNGETSRAARNPESWARFLDRWRPHLALLPNLPLAYGGKPFYRAFMPREDWALVYWDSKALVFVLRRAAPPDWLRRHEYGEPGDDRARHAAELVRAYSAIPFSLK
jgi:hypothetical protein